MKKTIRRINEDRLTAIIAEATKRALNELHYGYSGPDKISKPHDLTPWDGEEDPMEFDGLSDEEIEDYKKQRDKDYDEQEYYDNMECPDLEDEL